MVEPYRARHVTQKDGSALQWQNCRMAVGATHIDFHTRGNIVTDAAKMRSHQTDMVGGTDADDLRKAWERGYGQVLVIRNGRYWKDLLADRKAGRFVAVDVWYADLPDRCQTAASFGHTIGIAPEDNANGEWLVSDPLCAAYKWMDPAPIRIAAASWGRKVVGSGGMDTPLYYTTSIEDDMNTINTGGHVSSVMLASIPMGTPWYFDVGLSQKAGAFPSARQEPYIGSAGGGASRAVLIKTAHPYPDGIARETIVYVKASDIVVVPGPSAPPTDPEKIIAERDKEWVAHLTPPKG